MGKMPFPENEQRTSRTIIATRSARTRESLLYKSEYCRDGDGEYRLPTIREAASLMGFPYVYQFVGSENVKWRQIGNSVCPHQGAAIAKSLRKRMNLAVIPHSAISFSGLRSNIGKVDNLNTFTKKSFESPNKRLVSAKFRRHALKLGNMTVDLMNYHPSRPHITGKYWYVVAFLGTGQGYKVKVFSKKEKGVLEEALVSSLKRFDKYKNEIDSIIANKQSMQRAYEDDLHLTSRKNPISLLKELAEIITSHDCHRNFSDHQVHYEKQKSPVGTDNVRLRTINDTESRRQQLAMTRETRIQKIEKICQQKPLTDEEIVWEDRLESMPVYRIPLDYLIYNKYNGRILSRTKSLESRGRRLNPESDDDKKIIEKFLWDSKIDRNRNTLNDLKRHGQKRSGIITRDGVVVDGNRRVMLLNRIDDCNFFKAIILPIKSDDNPIEIEKLETSYQMGEDEKLRYNPIEKYLKTKSLEQKTVSLKEIADWMGETLESIQEYLLVMQTMEEYLDHLQCSGIYTQLDNRENQFINLSKWASNFDGGGSLKAFDGYSDLDVDDLKIIAFDYIRVKYEGKKFRWLAHGRKENHLFGNKQLWESFRDAHFENINPIRQEEDPIDFDSPNLPSSLDARDSSFADKARPLLDENLTEHQRQIYNQQHKNQPKKLVTSAIASLEVARDNKNIAKSDVLDEVEKLNEISTDILKGHSPSRLLARISELISSIEAPVPPEETESSLDYVKEIKRKAYQLEKQIKKSK